MGLNLSEIIFDENRSRLIEKEATELYLEEFSIQETSRPLVTAFEATIHA
jgi:hypothetical protein